MADGPKNFNNNRVLVVLLGVAFVSSVAALFAYNRYLATMPNLHDDVIAYVESVNPGTKRRSSNRFEFQEISEAEPLGNGDYIHSTEGSELLLKFNNGPRILIGEKSLIGLRQIEGTTELKVEKGAFSGTFGESDTIEVVTENDLVTLNGEQESQFAVAYSVNSGLEISSFDQELKVEYNGKSASIKNQTAKVSQKGGIEVKQGRGVAGTGSPTKVNAATPPQLPQGVEVDQTPVDPNTNVTAPYPQADQMFFHVKGGSIPVFPKATCSGPCEVKIFINGTEAMSKLFARDAAPLIRLKIAPGMEAKVRWEFSDGGQKSEGSFEVRLNNKENFEKAFATKQPVEVLN
ncbi:MAG: hypothetical protein ABL958_02090 [Bdellovibrionia bacterium]